MMPVCKREITKEQYDRAMKNNRYIAKEDKETVFTPSELYGYGVYDDSVCEEDGKYFVEFVTGSTCD